MMNDLSIDPLMWYKCLIFAAYIPTYYSNKMTYSWTAIKSTSSAVLLYKYQNLVQKQMFYANYFGKGY